MKSHNNKFVVIYSGGLDSTVLLGLLRAVAADVHAISFNYGQRHKVELESAKAICQSLQVTHQIVDLRALKELLPSALTGTSEVPQGMYDEESMKATIVPNRNMIMLSIAAGYAEGLGFNNVATAVHSGDHAIYPDCRPEFGKSVNQTIQLATGHTVQVQFPFVHMSKTEIVRFGAHTSMAPIMAISWSCYEGNQKHCGRCGTCVERRLAFIEADVKDHTQYEDPTTDWLEALCREKGKHFGRVTPSGIWFNPNLE